MSHRLVWSLIVLWSFPTLAPAADPAAQVRQKLYVTNSAGDDVTIIDVATHEPIGRIEVGPHPHGIAVPAAQDMIKNLVHGNEQVAATARKLFSVADKADWSFDILDATRVSYNYEITYFATNGFQRKLAAQTSENGQLVVPI